jgi:hypothetical protein
MAEKPQRKTTKRKRRRWHRPEVKSGRLFESNSLACNKSPTEPREECDQGPFQTS